MRVVRLAAVLALAAPFVVVPLALRRAASAAASALGASASRAARELVRERPPDPDEPLAIGEVAPVSFVYATADVAEPAAAGVAKKTKKPKHATPARKGILVRAATVARAVRMGGRPSGTPVPASGARPAGLELAGVSRYGSGLRDGDVLTQVGGTPATSEGAVVGAVAGALRSGARVITAVVWRGPQRLDVAVEIPRLKGS